MSKNQQSHSDAFFDVWEVLLRYKWRFLLTSFIVMITILGGSLLLPRKYEAVAVFDRRTDMVMAEIMVHGAPRSFQNPRQSLIKELAGQPAIDELIERVGPEFVRRATLGDDTVDVRALRADLSRRILVEFDIATPNLDRVKVQYTSSDPNVARLIVNELVQSYIDRTRLEIDGRLREATSFFESQASLVKERVDEIATRKLNFEIEHGDLLPDSPNNVQTVKAMTEMNLTSARQKHDMLEMKLQAMRQRLTETPKSTPSFITEKNPELARMEVRLRELESQRALYVAVYKMTLKHPDLLAIEQEIDSIKGQIGNTETEVVTQKRFSNNPMHAELELQISTTQSELESQARQINALEDRLTSLGTTSADMFPIRAAYERLERELEQAHRQIDFWEENQRRVQMALSAEASNRGIRLDFVKPCDFIRKPVSPNLAQVLIATLGLGVFCGGLCVFLAHRSDSSFRSASEVTETLDLPVIGTVSEIISVQQRRIRNLKNMIVYPINVAGMVLVLGAMAGFLYLTLERPYYFDQESEKHAAPSAATEAIDSMPVIDMSGINPTPIAGFATEQE